MKRTAFTFCTLMAVGSFHTSVSADVLLIEAIATEPANAEGGLPRPTKGMSMAHVKGRYGEPVQRHAPVGTPGSRLQPPITRWTYPGFTVYVENAHVIHSVSHR